MPILPPTRTASQTASRSTEFRDWLQQQLLLANPRVPRVVLKKLLQHKNRSASLQGAWRYLVFRAYDVGEPLGVVVWEELRAAWLERQKAAERVPRPPAVEVARFAVQLSCVG